MNTKSGLKAILVSLYSKGGASDCCNFQTKIASSFGLGFFFSSANKWLQRHLSACLHIFGFCPAIPSGCHSGARKGFLAEKKKLTQEKGSQSQVCL